MSYKIALASSDGSIIDVHFGAAKEFAIYEVEEGTYSFLERRNISLENETEVPVGAGNRQGECCKEDGIPGCSSLSGGCNGGVNVTSPRVELISDCRCVVCKKTGIHIQKQLERRAITAFDVDCTVEEALKKITAYYERIDKHQSLKGLSNS